MSLRSAFRPENRFEGGPLVFNLREISSCIVNNPWKPQLWLFGNTLERQSVAVRVIGFIPYFYLQKPYTIDKEEFAECVNDSLKPFPSFRGSPAIVKIEIDELTPAVGYCESKRKELFKIYYNLPDLKKIMHYLKNTAFSIGNGDDILKVYHADWSITDLFLHETHIKMQSWVKVDSYCEPRLFDFRNYGESQIIDYYSTYCYIEKYTEFGRHIRMLPELQVIPHTLMCSIRICAKSEESSIDKLFSPDSEKKNDSIFLIVAVYYWMGESENRKSKVYEGSEYDILKELYHDINDIDIDCYAILTDNCNCLRYMYMRSHNKCGLSKFRQSVKVLPRYEKYIKTIGCVCYSHKLEHFGRSRLDVKESMKKMLVDPKLESFTLKTAITHPCLLKTPISKECEYKNDKYSYMQAQFLPLQFAKESLQREVDLMTNIEQDNNMLLGFVELSRACFGSLTAMVENGQQIRVWKKLMHRFHTQRLLANVELLLIPPVIVNRAKKDSSFPNPPEIENIPVIGSVKKENVKSSTTVNLFGAIVREQPKKKKVKRYTGGFVCEPEIGYYHKIEQSTFTFDFSSLYPSIIQGFNVCYMRLVYDRKYLTDERYELEYVSINDTECVVLVKNFEDQNVETFLPQMTSEVCMERQYVKEKMKSPTLSTFEYKSLDAKQQACKVFQNALYGFLGVERHALFACPVLMAMVCCIGQYMIKTVKYYLIKNYKAYNVYGDTDSVMVQFPLPSNLKAEEDILTYYYQLASEAEIMCSKLFPSPNKLEFETMKRIFILYLKKNYAALEYPAGKDGWKCIPKTTIKGLPFKKRDRCPWVRRIGFFVLDCLLKGNESQIIRFLKK